MKGTALCVKDEKASHEDMSTVDSDCRCPLSMATVSTPCLIIMTGGYHSFEGIAVYQIARTTWGFCHVIQSPASAFNQFFAFYMVWVVWGRMYLLGISYSACASFKLHIYSYPLSLFEHASSRTCLVDLL
ncbi:uncharacterized protein LOC130781274 [Actinidia eriantha]|uniref:uncharacterized protein LOC130781274 n=1 Tax=Actinidia eriantha TaxID=165200 RepID=UPI002588D21F|nr:uncharacterized protein LOC130781274 [Actinidia eriantha]XP_057496400.1 uncharacterized protein LOC130781274 [Actinidia eriantha]XP_057496401.1 uncharacterized protein LOC130781274 [Actinidia eriantha]XP_057496402.1 uncharacterized protein LOC130781274 [Actinidia eriantha]